MLAAAILAALLAAYGAGALLARAGFPLPDPGKRIGQLDGLRGYLALAVMVHHFDIWLERTQHGIRWGQSSALWLANLGPAGVALFFMTTGAVFYPRIRAGLRAVDWRALYVSRLFRILPLQLATLVVIAAIAWRLGEAGAPLVATAKALAMWVTSYAEPPLFGFADAGLINAAVLWSLWYEWIFYFAVLPLAALLRDLTRARLPAWGLPLALLVIGLVLGPMIARPRILYYLPLFALGMVALDLAEHPRARRWLAAPGMALVVAGLVALALARAPLPFPPPQLFAYALFFACAAAGNRFGGLLAAKGSVVLGECSFGLYLIHGIVLFTLFTFVLPAGAPVTLAYAALPAAAVIAVVVSALAHLAIERPGMRLGKRLARRLGSRPVPGGRPAADSAP